jgi:hypothetical protein
MCFYLQCGETIWEIIHFNDKLNLILKAFNRLTTDSIAGTIVAQFLGCTVLV